MNIESSSSVKGKWKRGLSKLRRQSTVSELSPSLDCPSIMEEDENLSEKEMQHYLAKLKKKTGLNMLWSGRKFNETIDKDPDIDISEPVSLMRSTLELDSDEEDLHKFIQNLTDDEQDDGSEDASTAKSSEGELDLMKNMNFAEVAAGEYKLGTIEPDDDLDFMPRIVQPEFQEDHSEKQDDSLSSAVGIFRGNIQLIDSDEVDSQESSLKSDTIQSVIHKTISEAIDDGCTEEIADYGDSRAKSPMKSTEYNYTDSRFDSYDTEFHDKTRDSRLQSNSESDVDNSITRSSSRTSSSKTSVRLSPEFKDAKKDKNKKKSKRHSSSKASSSSSSSYSTSSSQSSKTLTVDASKNAKRKQSSNSKREPRSTKTPNSKNSSTQTKFDTKRDYNLLVDDALLRPDFASKYLDPSPIAATVASSDAIEAVTSYNPSVLALNDLLKYQLQLTRQHIDNSWRLYNAYTAPEALGKHRYTTLKETMKYIKNKAPSVITYEEALKQVKNEEI